MHNSETKVAIVWTAVNTLLAPLIGWGLGKSDLHPLLVMYAIIIIFLAPLGYMLWCNNIRG